MKDRRERETERQTSRHTSTIEDRDNELDLNRVRQTERNILRQDREGESARRKIYCTELTLLVDPVRRKKDV